MSQLESLLWEFRAVIEKERTVSGGLQHMTFDHIFHYIVWEMESTETEKVEANVQGRSKKQLTGVSC